jgi:hypothetical protein
MPRVGLEPTIPVFEPAKTVHALDRAATVIGPSHLWSPKISLSVWIMFYYILLYLIIFYTKVYITPLCVKYIFMCNCRVLRRIFGTKGDKIIGGRRKLHNEELHDLYSSLNMIIMISQGG